MRRKQGTILAGYVYYGGTELIRQAVLLAQELGLGRVYSQAQQERMTVRDMARVRARQRLW